MQRGGGRGNASHVNALLRNKSFGCNGLKTVVSDFSLPATPISGVQFRYLSPAKHRMATPGTTVGPIRFATFELNPETGELRNKGAKIRIEGQPLLVLQVLLEKPGELVTRDELKQRLWPTDTFVDFDHSINVAIKRLREALQDSAASPRFIETLPRRGYRFIYPVNGGTPTEAPEPAPQSRRRRTVVVALAGIGVAIAAGLLFNVGGLRDRALSRPKAGEIKRIAVLPLRQLSGDTEERYLAVGFTEMVITELGRLQGIDVLSHQSVLQYAGSDKPLPEIARELNVDAVVEGTVLQSGDRIRVTINVVQTHPERHVLSKSYEREFRDVFEVQREVAAAVSSLIRPNLTTAAESPSSMRPVAPEVTEAYLRGQAHWANGTDQDRVKAAEWFEKAVAADPEFAPAYAYLALLYSHGGGARKGEGGMRSRVLARQWAEKALQLSEKQAVAHAALGWLEFLDWDWSGADKEFSRAIELNPGFMTARTWYAQYLASLGRVDDAMAQAEIVVRLDPVSPNNVSHAAWAMLACGRVDEGMRHLRQVVDLEPGYWVAHRYLADGYLRKGMHQEAIKELQIALKLNPGFVQALGALAYAHALAGERAEAQRIVKELEQQRTRAETAGNWLPVNVMVPAYLAIGEKDKAISYLERTYERRGGGMAMLNTEATLRPLLSDPRFQQLLRRVGLPVLQP